MINSSAVQSDQVTGLLKSLGLSLNDLKEIAKTIFEKDNPLELSFNMKGETETEQEAPYFPSPLARMGVMAEPTEKERETEVIRQIHDESYNFTRKQDGNIELNLKKNNRLIRIGEGELKEFKATANTTITVVVMRSEKPDSAEK